MSHPSEAELESLGQIADELREVFAARGYRVDVAMEADPAFGSGYARSAVARDLALDSVGAAASRVGVDFRPVNGGGRQLRMFDGKADRRYRVKKAHKNASGDYIVAAGSDSALGSEPSDDGSLLVEDQWVFGYTEAPNNLIGDVFAARVLGKVDGKPGHLLLGRAISLGSVAPPSGGGFQPSDEGLKGFGEDEDFGEGDASGAQS